MHILDFGFQFLIVFYMANIPQTLHTHTVLTKLKAIQRIRGTLNTFSRSLQCVLFFNQKVYDHG
jgi:hypothetical protein